MAGVLTPRIRACLVDDIRAEAGFTPGAIEIVEYKPVEGEESVGFAFRCPCGCGCEGYLPIRPANRLTPSWEWDGNREAPTLTPSVLFRGGCEWHGWLRNGIWESC